MNERSMSRLRSRSLYCLFTTCTLLAASGPVAAWGDLGHQVTALIAYAHLTPTAKAQLDELLMADTDPLTARDFASRASWADRYRNTHRETAAWHYVDMEIDHPDLSAACFGFPALSSGQVASAGPAKDCIVNKITEFEAELRDPATSTPERLLALKFLIHFIGDLHQPLHASDHEDRGGNCIDLAPSPDGHDTNLHAYWDVGAVEALGNSASVIAADLDARITPGQLTEWSQGDPKTWAMESFALGRRDVYSLATRPGCNEHGSVTLTLQYESAATKDAALQLEKAGVRMATVLNLALPPK
jgi:nuclease S1